MGRWFARITKDLADEAAQPPISRWTIDTTLRDDDQTFSLWGHPGDLTDDETLGIVDALEAGLRAAGYDPQVTIERTTKVTR